MHHRLLLLLALAHFPALLPAEIADPAKHPYADPAGGREQYTLARERVNESRLYDFYQRQADYYMAQKEEVPALLPAYPGLDAGRHGHWGQHNQNGHIDGRWNEVDHGPVIAHLFRTKEMTIVKALCVKLGANDDLSAVFDTQSLSWRAIWQGGFVKFDGQRWGGSRNAVPSGKIWFQDKETRGWEGDKEGRFLGSYRHGHQVIMSYEIGRIPVLEVGSQVGTKEHPVFARTLQFPGGVPKGGLKLRGGVEVDGRIATPVPGAQLKSEHGALWLEFGELKKGTVVPLVLYPKGTAPAGLVARTVPSQFLKGGRAQFPETSTVVAILSKEERPYVVDTIPVPFDNHYKTVMQLTGIAFFPNGDALVTVWCGEVWKVSGLGGEMVKVTWKRYATGFDQPMGVHIDEDGVFVLDRGRITRLHDLNGDDEADFYENYADDFRGYDRSHTMSWGLVRTPDKAFHFVERNSVLRTSASPKTDPVASGLRNCMGVGLWQGRFYVAPQEGNWTPASMIIEVKPGEFYGDNAYGHPDRKIALPLCYVPRGVDNSTGGMVAVTSDQWGPLVDHFLGLSYGSGLHYIILRDDSGPRAQGATVPLDGEFRAGTMRGAFHPVDRQLYVVGLDGWGDYSTQDGCLHRVRYTGKPVRKPIGFRVHSNGIRIEFSCKLDAAEAEKTSNYFAQQWNYLYADQYGSPEFSVRQPGTVGHDHTTIRSVHLLEDGNTIFVEIPDLEPTMQMQIRMHLRDANGTSFKTDLFPSVLYLGNYFKSEGLAAPVPNKLTVINLPIKWRREIVKDTVSGEEIEGARELLVEVLGGLQFKQSELRASAGEALTLKLLNKDVMPHNLVLVAPGATKEVGLTAFKMLNDPKASEKHYVPDLQSVLAHTFVVPPGGSHLTHFRAPSKPGRYPFLCTFPGHWQAMQGVLIVE